MNQLSFFDLNWRAGKVVHLTAQLFGWDFCISKNCELLVHYPEDTIRDPEVFKLRSIDECKDLACKLSTKKNMNIIDKEELIELFDRFLCETGNWYNFKAFVEKQGYTVEELGFSDE